jgi:hypothetical protein
MKHVTDRVNATDPIIIKVVVAAVRCQIFKCIFILTSNGEIHSFTILASGSERHQQGRGKYSKFHLREGRDISAKPVIPLKN